MVSLTGYLGFMAIQLVVYYMLLLFNVVDIADSQHLWGFGTYLIQATSEIMCVIIGLIAYKHGFSFIYRPPHDLKVREKLRASGIIGIILGNLIIYGALYWILNFHTLYIIPVVVVGFVFLLFVHYKKEYKR